MFPTRLTEQCMFMKLRGGTAHFHMETGRWRGVPREERFCKECPSGDIEDVGHWLLHSDAWQASRVILLEIKAASSSQSG